MIPAGVFNAPRGALAGAGPWNLTEAAAARIVAVSTTRTADITIDYEHQLLAAAENGLPAPASGWVKPQSLRWVPDGEEPGLYGDVSWTPRAAQMIEADEYRYLSPVFTYDPSTGEPLDLLHVALTNFPAIDAPIRAALSARAALNPSTETPVNETLKKLLAALGLPETTAEADALAGVAALKAKADAQGTEIAALKAAAPDPAKFVPISAMQGVQAELAALTARINGDEAGRLIEQAITDGKLVEAQRQWAADLGKKDLAALKAYVASAPAIAALAGMQTRDNPPAGQGDEALSAGALAVCSLMGLTPEQFKKGAK